MCMSFVKFKVNHKYGEHFETESKWIITPNSHKSLSLWIKWNKKLPLQIIIEQNQTVHDLKCFQRTHSTFFRFSLQCQFQSSVAWKQRSANNLIFFYRCIGVLDLLVLNLFGKIVWKSKKYSGYYFYP